jgi:hypothetical protein
MEERDGYQTLRHLKSGDAWTVSEILCAPCELAGSCLNDRGEPAGPCDCTDSCRGKPAGPCDCTDLGGDSYMLDDALGELDSARDGGDREQIGDAIDNAGFYLEDWYATLRKILHPEKVAAEQTEDDAATGIGWLT